MNTARIRDLVRFAGLAAGVLLVPAVLRAQPTPHLAYVFPAGGRQGATFQVTVGGQFLNGATNASVSGDGVRVAVLDYTRPLTQKQFNDLRDKMRELQNKRQAAARADRKRRDSASPAPNVAWTAADEKQIADIRRKLITFAGKRNQNPALAETVTLRVTLATNAGPGERELRLWTPQGLSNPLVFCVGQFPEFSKKETKIPDDPMALRQLRFNAEQKAVAPTEMTITLPATVNGQILPGGVDRYRFTARKGQRLVICAQARELIPYLADAVPGWFQATLTLYNAKSEEVAYDDDFRFNPDPVLFFEVPKDGEYTLEIKDAIYRGREDFVYRITVGEQPFVTSIFPLGARAGSQTAVELKGWNLAAPTLQMDARDQPPGISLLSVTNSDRVSNLVPFAIDSLPELLESEPNNQPTEAQLVTLPLIVNGRIEPPGDSDVFRFEGRAGQEIVAEVVARRLNSPLDSVLKLTDRAGRQLAFNDDCEDKGSGLLTHHADSRLAAILPTNGTYYLAIADAQHKGGPEYAYRLRLSAPRPDFDLRVTPSSISLRGGSSVPLTVYALRKDGFSNEIALALNDAPAGFSLSGARIPANQDQVRLTLTAPPSARGEPVSISLEGRAFIQGKPVVHAAVPADDMMQAFAYHHLVPAKGLEVAVSGRFIPRAPVRVLSESPVKIPAGGTARVRLNAPIDMFEGRLQLELSDPPEGITIQSVAAAGGGTELLLRCDAAKIKPGLQGNLIVSAFPGKALAARKGNAPANRQRIAVGSLPAISFEIVAQ